MRSDVSEYLEDWDDDDFSQISVHQISGSITTSSTMRSDVSEYLEDWDDRSPRRLHAGRAGLRLSPPRCKGVLLLLLLLLVLLLLFFGVVCVFVNKDSLLLAAKVFCCMCVCLCVCVCVHTHVSLLLVVCAPAVMHASMYT